MGKILGESTMISNLGTNNFKKIGTKQFEFAHGLNVLRGPNWSGKSTTLNAIKFALQGIQGIPGSKDDIPSWDVNGKCDVAIALGEHSIVRSLNDCNIYRKGNEGKPVATGHTACNAYLDDLFGISVANYNMLHFSDQGETAGLLTIGAAELQKMVEKIADVTIIDQVIKLANADDLVLKGKLEGKVLTDTKELVADISTAEERVVDLQKKLDKNSTELAEVKEFVVEKSELVTDLTKTVANVTESEKLLSGYLVTKENLLAKLEELAEKLSKKPEPLGDLELESITLQDLILCGTEELNEGQESAARHEIITSWLTNVSSSALLDEVNWLADEKKLVAEVDELNDKFITARTERDAKAAELETAVAAMESSICLTCKRPFDEDKEHEETQKAAIDKLKEEKTAAQTLRADLQTELATSKAKLKTLQDKPPINRNVEATIKTLKAEASELEGKLKSDEELAKLQVELPKWDEELIEVRAKIQVVDEATKQYAKANTDHVAATEDLIEVQTGISKCEEVITDVKELNNNIQTLTRELQDAQLVETKLTLSVSNLTSVELPAMEQTLGTGNDLLKVTEAANKALRDNRTEKAEIVSLVKYLRDSRSRFLKTVWDRILGYASTFCKTCTGDEVQGVVRDAKGKFKFIEDSVERPVASASGAQKAFMGVGVRLGLAKALYGDSSFMVLDEPSSDMSVENSTRLVSTLMGTGMQIIYSTHSELEELAAGHVIDLGDM